MNVVMSFLEKKTRDIKVFKMITSKNEAKAMAKSKHTWCDC